MVIIQVFRKIVATLLSKNLLLLFLKIHQLIEVGYGGNVNDLGMER